jgi:hypothetical protein
MEIGEIVGSIIAFSIIAGFLWVYYKTKDLKTTLVIVQDNNTMRLYLDEDDYKRYNISTIKDDQKRVDDSLREFAKAKAKKLVRFIDKVSLSKRDDEEFEKELLAIIHHPDNLKLFSKRG